MESSTQTRSSIQKNAWMPNRAQALARERTVPSRHPTLYGSRKRQHLARIRATRRSGCQGLPAVWPDESWLHLCRTDFTSLFQEHAGLKGHFLIHILLKQFHDARYCAQRRCGTRFNGLVDAREVIPGKRLHVRAEHEVCMALPDFELMLLRCAYGAAHHLENVGGSAAMAILHADGNANYRFCAQAADSPRRNRRHKTAIGKASRANLDRRKQPREGATRADGIDKIALRKNHRLTGGQIRRDNRQRNLQIFKLARTEHALHQHP